MVEDKEDPAAGHPASGHPATGHPAAGHPATGHSTTGHHTKGHPAAGHLAAGHPTAGPPKLTYLEALRGHLTCRIAAGTSAVNGRLDAAHRQLRGQEVLLVTLLCLCCTLLCVFVTHREGGGS